MAALDGFRVPLTGVQSGMWTSQAERHRVVQSGLADSKQWDLPNRVPLGYLSRMDASGRENRFSQPHITMARDPISPNQSFVPLPPTSLRQTGMTADSIRLFDSIFVSPQYRSHELKLGRTRVPLVADAHRHHPYQRSRIRSATTLVGSS